MDITIDIVERALNIKPKAAIVSHISPHYPSQRFHRRPNAKRRKRNVHGYLDPQSAASLAGARRDAELHT